MNMDSSIKLDVVIPPNALVRTSSCDIVQVKNELLEEETANIVDDFDFEPFHENVFRTLSANFDNACNIAQVDEAYESLESCFIENNILTKNGLSKFLSKSPVKNCQFLKYRDIDDAFVDMVISDSASELVKSNQPSKKIDLRSFKDIFSLNFNESSLSDNEESLSRNGESDVEEIKDSDSRLDGSQSENDSETELDLSNKVGESFSNLPPSVNKLTILSVDKVRNSENEHDSQSSDIVEVPNISVSPLKKTVKDVRIRLRRCDIEINKKKLSKEESDFDTYSALPLNQDVSKGTRQVARKKTGGVVKKQIIQNSNNVNKEQKSFHQISSKDAEPVPSVFDKMTRAAKRDLERALAESTANLVIQKTSELISEKIKEIKPNEKVDADSSSSSEDEGKENDIHKTAEIITNTIIQFLTKNRTKKLDKLGKDISEEICNNISALKVNHENIVEEVANKTPKSSPVGSVPHSTSELPTEYREENKSEELENNRRVTRESARMSCMRRRSSNKQSFTSKIAGKDEEEVPSKCKAAEIGEIPTEIESDTVEIRRPETRQSKQKLLEKKSEVEVSDSLLPQVRKTRSRQTSNMQTRRRNPRRSINRPINQLNSSSEAENQSGEQLIDSQFLNDSEISEDLDFCLNDTELSKISSDAYERFLSLNDENSDKSLSDEVVDKTSSNATRSKNSINLDKVNENGQAGLKNSLCSEDAVQFRNENKEANNIIASMTTSFSKENKSTGDGIIKNSYNEEKDSNFQKLKDDQGKMLVDKSVEKSGTNTMLGVINSVKDIVAVDATGQNSNDIILLTENKENFDLVNVSKACNSLPLEEQSMRKKGSVEEYKEKNSSENDKIFENRSTVPEESIKQVSFQVLNHIVTHIENNQQTAENLVLSSDKPTSAQKSQSGCSDLASDSLPGNMSFLNYTMEDSFKLVIDEKTQIKELCQNNSILEEKKARYDVLTVRNKSTEGSVETDCNKSVQQSDNLNIKEFNLIMDHKIINKIEDDPPIEVKDFEKELESDNILIESKYFVNTSNCREELKDEPNFRLSQTSANTKLLTNEQKIAQLTKRDPRLIHDKKIIPISLRDPRIRKKLPLIVDKKPEELPKKIEEKPNQLSIKIEGKTNNSATAQKFEEKNIPSPKIEENHLTVISESPLSPVLEQEVVKSKPDSISSLTSQDKYAESNSKLELFEANDYNRRKKTKREVDNELLYKTPLSDLHESGSDRPSYERNSKKKRLAPKTNGDRTLILKRTYTYEERYEERVGFNNQLEERGGRPYQTEERGGRPYQKEERGNFGRQFEDREAYNNHFEETAAFVHQLEDRGNRSHQQKDRDAYSRYLEERAAYNHHLNEERRVYAHQLEEREDNNQFIKGNECYDRDERNFSAPHREEGYRSGDFYFRGSGEMGFHPMERNHDFHQGGRREEYEEKTFFRRTLGEGNCAGPSNRDDLPDNQVYSRREYMRRSNVAPNNPSFRETLQENIFFPPQNNFPIINDTTFQVPAYQPMSLLTEPLFGPDEEFDQSCNMDSDSFSPPSSDLCPPAPLIRSPTPDAIRRESYCPSPPRIGGRNVDSDDRNNKNKSHFSREDISKKNSPGSYKRSSRRDYVRREDSPPRKRYPLDRSRSREDDRGRWRRSPSWSPNRSDRRRRERSMTPPSKARAWDSPSPPRYRDRGPYSSYRYS